MNSSLLTDALEKKSGLQLELAATKELLATEAAQKASALVSPEDLQKRLMHYEQLVQKQKDDQVALETEIKRITVCIFCLYRDHTDLR